MVISNLVHSLEFSLFFFTKAQNAKVELIVDNGTAHNNLEIELNGPDYGENFNDGTPLAGTASILNGAGTNRMVMQIHLLSKIKAKRIITTGRFIMVQ